MTGLVSSASNALRTRIVKYVSEKKPVHTGLLRMTILGMILTKIKMTDGNYSLQQAICHLNRYLNYIYIK